MVKGRVENAPIFDGHPFHYMEANDYPQTGNTIWEETSHHSQTLPTGHPDDMHRS